MELAETESLKKLRRELDKLYSENIETTDIPSELFHYTNAQGLKGIFDSQCLWATHAYYLNDATEILYTRELVEGINDDLREKTRAGNKAILDINSPMYAYQYFLASLSYKTRKVKPDPDVYVACFCEKDDLLSQWRSYGDKGSGYAIGFDANLLNHSGNAFMLRKVSYSPEAQAQIISEALEVVAGSFLRLTNGINFESALSLMDAHASIFDEEITRYAAFFKHSTFSEEEEWRLIYFPTEGDSSIQIKYRSGSLGIIPYIEIDLPEGKTKSPHGQYPIVSIKAGPSMHPELSKKALGMLAKQKHLNLKISGSGIPLR